MLKAIAIDDEPIALDIVKNLSAKISFIDVVAFFTNVFDAITYLQQVKIDLIFLDIKMPDISGIDFLKSIANPPMVIFTTAYSGHAVQSFELNAIDYLLKPFSQSRFLKACNKAHEQFTLRKNSSGSSPGFIFIKSGYEQVKINTDDILFAESNGNYVTFVLKDSRLLSRLTMSETEALLPASIFVRVHRSYIAAKKYITKIDRSSVWVDKTELPIGSSYADEVAKITS